MTNGLNRIVANYGKDTYATVELLFESQADYDPDKLHPHYNEEEYNDDRDIEEEEFGTESNYDPAKDSLPFNRYYRRLEDICSGYLEKYVSNLCFTIFQRTNSHGALEFNKSHRILDGFKDNEDGTFIERADLALRVNEHEWSAQQKNQALVNLPYVLKRLHNLSKYCGVHMLSMIAAFISARFDNDNDRRQGSTKTLKKNDVISRGVYKCDRNGNIGDLITVASKNKKADVMFNWLAGNSDSYVCYREDFINFKYYCEVLNIDLVNDDMTQYDNDFMDSLEVTTLTPNTQYDATVYASLHKVEEIKPTDLKSYTMSSFVDVCSSNSDLRRVASEFNRMKAQDHMEIAKQLYVYYRVVFERQVCPDDSKFSWMDGYLHYAGELCEMSTILISDAVFAVPTFIISELGFCVHYGNLCYLEMMTVYCALDNMKHLYIDRNSEEALYKWVKFE